MARFILDTNVLSELFRPEPNAGVSRWVAAQDPQALFLTVFTIGEIRIGVQKLSPGRKRAALEAWLEEAVLPNFAGRILVFDGNAATIWASLVASDTKNGRPRPTIDAMITAIALSHGMDLVTRNVRDFADCDVRLVNPFL